MAVKFLKVVKTDSSNKFLPAPLRVGEIVTHIPDESIDNAPRRNYVKVIHNEGKNRSVFRFSDFESYNPKSKDELKTLLIKKAIFPDNEKS